MSPAYVKPYVKRSKTDANDAEAICGAVTRPTMRFVPMDLIDTTPEAICSRPISLRAFTATGEMLHADLAAGAELEPLIETFFADPDVAYLHAHYAKRGCYAARIITS